MDYTKQLLNLAEEMKNAVVVSQQKSGAKSEEEKLEEMRTLKNQSCILLLLISVLWIIIVFVVSLFKVLTVWKTNLAGLFFLGLFGIVLILQFFAMLLHNVTMGLVNIAKTPFFSLKDCRFTVADEKKGERKKK